MFIHRSRRVLDASKHSFSILEPFIGLGLGPASPAPGPNPSLGLWLSRWASVVLHRMWALAGM